MSRKKIAFVTMNPESDVIQGLLDGVFEQSKALGYDVAVIAPLVHSSHYFKDYLKGELKIFDIINFDLFDGFIVTPSMLQENGTIDIYQKLLALFEEKCHAPVVSIDLKFGDYEIVYSDEFTGIKMITEHVIMKHGCKDITVLTGNKGIHISDERVLGIREAMAQHGLILSDKDVIYGDYWYPSGEKLADEIASGERHKPDAVICASDHMAIGLIERLQMHGIRVPEDIIVTGYGGTMDSAINIPPLTTFADDKSYTGALAVSKLSERIDPDAESIPLHTAGSENIILGGTCGCPEDTVRIRKKIRDYMYTSAYKSRIDGDAKGISMTALLNSYVSEAYTASRNVEECLINIYESLFLLKPYKCFYLCMNENWLDPNHVDDGYADRMKLAVYSDMEKKKHGYRNHIFYSEESEILFDKSDMLPVFEKKYDGRIPGIEAVEEGEDIFDTPQVYYFSPIHVNDGAIGYIATQFDIDSPVRVSIVYRNYMRYIANALEMSRAKEFVIDISEHDQLTGLYNRRGMERLYENNLARLKKKAQEQPEKDYRVLAVMIDMNNLKLTNDSEGHEAGDLGIKTISKAIKAAIGRNEFAIRAGGDEFYIIGFNEYDNKYCEELLERIKENIEAENKKLGEGYNYSAAAGYALAKIEDCDDWHSLIDEADTQMYIDKRRSKRVRH